MKIGKWEIDGKKVLVGAAKVVVGGAASFGAGFIITRYGNLVIRPNEKIVRKVLMSIGSAALAGMVGDACGKYVEKQIDTCIDAIDQTTKLVKGENIISDVTVEFTKEESENV